jgi:hypothetical protein
MFRVPGRLVPVFAASVLVAALAGDAEAGMVTVNLKENMKNTDKVNSAYSFASFAPDNNLKYLAANPTPDSGVWHTSKIDNDPKDGQAELRIFSFANPGAMLTVPAQGKTQVNFGFTFDDTKSNGRVKYAYLDQNGKPLGLEPVALQVSPVFNGTTVTVAIGNDSGSKLSGSFSVYANPGISTLLPTSGFDSLQPGAIPIVSDESYSLFNGDKLPTITGTIPAGDYLLVVGTADDSSGDGPQNFAVGAASVPEPATLVLGVAASLMLAGFDLSRRCGRMNRRGPAHLGREDGAAPCFH